MAKEFERKACLSAEEYHALLSAFSRLTAGHAYTQVNTYYDTKELFLGKSSRTLRVREKNGTKNLEYKYDQSTSGEIRTATEYTAPLSKLPESIASDLLPECLPATRFFPLGSLTTERTDFQIEGALVSLDKNTYLGYTDYELEIESEENAALPAVITDIYSNFSRPVIGKFHRFLMRYTLSDSTDRKNKAFTKNNEKI